MIYKVPVALNLCESYTSPFLEKIIYEILEKAELPIKSGMQVLVKPNLLLPEYLACTDPHIVYYCCKWLIENGVIPKVGDNPGFGNPDVIAKKIGLTSLLGKLGLKMTSLKKSRNIQLNMAPAKKTVHMPISEEALNSDLIFSIPRIKAHSQLRLTLAVKNCFGLIPGLRKAFVHVFYGSDIKFFSDCLAALYKALPPVCGLADGIITMSQTGPAKGIPLKMNLLGACSSAEWLDQILINILGYKIEDIPLAHAVNRLNHAYPELIFPLLKPCEINNNGFEAPKNLRDVSFNPYILTKSILKRTFYNIFLKS